MRPHVRRWIGLIVFALVLGVVFVNLGEWQLRRLDERKARNAAVIAAGQAPVADGADVLSRPLTPADEYRRIRVSGTYLPDRQWVVRNRALGDERGYEVVTVMRTDTGQLVLVDRGFLPLGPGVRQPDTAPAPPSGTVEITAVIRADERGGPGAEEPSQGQVRVINSVALAQATGEPLITGHLRLLESQPGQQGDLRPASSPPLDEGPHFSYAVQWFLFTLIGVIGVVFFIRADLRDRRRARERAAAAAAPREPDASSGPEDRSAGQDVTAGAGRRSSSGPAISDERG